MTRKQLEEFRQKLESERARLAAQLAAAREKAREPGEGDVGDVGDASARDLAVDTELDVVELRTREREEIDDALDRIDRGDYGTCEVCGRPIELDRLEAMPTARLCKEDARRADVEKRPTL